MALGFLQACTPSIKPMPLQKKTMNTGAFPQGIRNAFPQFNHVLWVRTPSSPLSISYPSKAMPPCEACEPERTVLQTE